MLEIITDELKKITEDFYNILKIKIVLYDEKRRFLYSYPDRMNEFCAAVRTNASLTKKCFACDQIGFDICDQTRKPYIYRCHMNLTEVIAPIIENNMIIGYLMLGQILIDTDIHKVRQKMEMIAQIYHFDPDILEKNMDTLSIMTNASLQSAASILSMCACYLYVNQIIRSKSTLLSYQLKDYITSHLADELSISTLCKKFYISRSKLYTISKESLGMGITDYIRLQRIQLVKQLLTDTTDSIASIAEQTGFSDANYLIRTFKRVTGITPKQYRRQQTFQ